MSPFTRSQALAGGVTRWELQRAVTEGRIRPVIRDVYTKAQVTDDLRLRIAALSLIAPRTVVICDRTAAWVHGVDVRRYRELGGLPRLEVVSLRGCEPMKRPQILSGERDLVPEDVMELDGVLVTTPLRTALDLGCKLWRYDAMAAMDALMATFGITRADLERELPRYRRRRGVVQLRQLVANADPKSESARESWVRLMIADANLPAPASQVWVYDGIVPVYRLDFAYEHAQIAIEYDGGVHLDPEQAEKDRIRRAWLEDRGWTVIVLRKKDFTSEGIARWTARLGELLRATERGDHARINPAFRGVQAR
jgi:Protein of unknown function (DUF559)